MGVISVGASLGVAERAAGRVPSVSPSAAAVTASAGANASQLGAASSATYQATMTPTTTAATHTLHNHHNHHHARRQHEYHAHSGPQATYSSGGRNKRGGRRKYTQQTNHQNAHTNTNASANAITTNASSAPPSPFPPPPIVTSASLLSAPPSAAATITTSSPAAKTASITRATSTTSAAVSGSRYSVVTAPTSSSQVVRVVTFETNVDPPLLIPFVLGAKGGVRLHALMAHLKCTMAHRPASLGSAPGEVVIRLTRSSPSSIYNASKKERKISFTLTADTIKGVDDGLQLLQGAIETAEQVLARKKKPWTIMSAGAVATPVAVDSGGNGKPSSGHASASRAAMPDHSIDDPPPPSRLASSLPSPAPLSIHEHAHDINHDSVDERKAQTRIRYPPTNQPLKRGPGFAPSRSIAESTASVATATPSVTTFNVDKNPSKKRQLPPSNDDANRREPNKRERTASTAHDAAIEDAHPHPNNTMQASEVASASLQQSGGATDSAADPEFDEFRIRLTRGIEFARQVDFQAARVKQRMLREKQRYFQMLQQVQLTKQQQRVADVVIRTQCAIMATSDSSGRKRRRIEQLSAAQDAMQRSLLETKTTVPTMGPSRNRLASNRLNNRRASSPDLTELIRKVAAFRNAVSKKSVDSSFQEKLNSVPEDRYKAQPQPVKSVVDVQEAVSNEDAEATKTSAVAVEVHDYGTPEPVDGEKPNDAFRPRHLAPGMLRDMNLIQDYTDESDCAILRLLIGQRQYFYLEPISLSFGTTDLNRLEFEATRTTNDLEILREFVVKHRRFATDLLQSVELVAAKATQAFTSSTASSWTTMQRSLLDIHPLLLVLHLLALHYHAVTVLEQKKVALTLLKPDLLSGEDQLSSELFKFVLRPIRSSAIESSLNDALPISLVRETIAHCPEVVNHVLDWKEESDVPPVLLHDVASTQSIKDKSFCASSTGSPMLSETLRHLQRHTTDFDRSLSELARHLQGLRGGAISADKIVYLVNQLKANGARLLVANTQLQLHKWTTVFVENGFTWFDEDMDDDLGGDDVFGGDRSYDKFTCLQDALSVWHNTSLLYSAKEAGSLRAVSTTEPMDVSLTETKEPESESVVEQDLELNNLRRITPADLLNVMETTFTDPQAVATYVLKSEAIAQTRKAFDDSLAAMRASMKVLGRTAPWRTHVKHSNALKVEYTRQRELENKLLLHQWAAYYKNRPLPDRSENPVTCHEDEEHERITKPAEEEDQQGDLEVQKAVTGELSLNASDRSADPGIVLEPGDTAEVVDIKLLRHEIENVAKQMHSMGDVGAVDADRKKLLDACNLLAASCVSALTKFLSPDEPSPPGAGPVSARAARQRANSTSKTESSIPEAASKESTLSQTQLKPKQRSRGKSASEEVTPATFQVDKDSLDGQEDVFTETKREKPESSGIVKRAKKGSAAATTRRPRAHSTSSASPRVPPAATPAQVVPPLTTRGAEVKASASHAGAVAPIAAEPLRMGCSGCRDTRRRCTGCHGCCLHCVCLGCGCRMCCSSRTASVQRTLSLLVSAVETRMGCKWIELDTMGDHSERCGMVKACGMCQQCVDHCACHPSAQASYREGTTSSQATGGGTSATAGFPSAAARKERRFRINPTAAQRRQNVSSGASDDDASESSSRRSTSAGKASGVTTKRTRRSNSDAAPSMFKDDSVDYATGSDFMSSDFSGSSTDGISFVSRNPPAQHKNEQEDLFRAARVRMKLQRNTVLKAIHPYGLIPPNTLIEDELLWHPDRIRLMWERKDVYGVLGVPREASSQLIKKQYRKLVLKLHPDKALGTTEAVDAATSNHGESWSLDDRVSAFVAVTQAFKLLSGDIGAIHNYAWKTPTTSL